MSNRLGDSDRRAVDMLLDPSAGAGDGNSIGGYRTHAQLAPEPGIQSVQRVLNLLDLLPEDEPPADLVARTMERVDARGRSATLIPTPALLTDRPQA